MTEFEYPDPPIDSNEVSQMIRILREWDEKHSAKAAILARMAKTEWQAARAEEEPAVEGETDFLDFVDRTNEMVDEALERSEE